MNNEDIVIPIAFFVTVIIVSIGIPLVRALARRWDRQAVPAPAGADLGRLEDRLTRIEQSIDAMAIEVERISEGQRFTTRLLSERSQPDSAAGELRPAGATNNAAHTGRARGLTRGTEDVA